MSKYEVRYVGDWISYIYDNETKESVRISNEDFVRLLNKQDKQISDLEAKLAEKEQIIKEMEQKIDERDKRIDRLEEDYYQETRQLEWVTEQLNEYEAIKNKYKTIFLDRFVDAKVEDARIWKEEYDKLQQQLAEKDSTIKTLIEDSKDRKSVV